jgi:uncharacterized protein YndB with AHSA1/START domain
MTTDTMVTTQLYRVYIKASPEVIWDAITRPEWTERYGFGGRAEYDLRPGGTHRVAATKAMKAQGAKLGIDVPELMIEGEVLESDPPHRLVVTFRMNMGAEYEAEGFTRLTYEIEDGGSGVSKVTMIHDLEGAPKLAAVTAGELEAEGAGGGWAYFLSDLKSLLETGRPLRG